MSNRNDDNAGIAIAFAFIGMAALFMFALAAFAAAVLTILALCAWNKPLTLFGETLHPKDARAFVLRGLLGIVLLPVFAIFCAALFKFWISPEAWPYLLLGGYTLGSVGVEYLKTQAGQDEAANATYIPPAPPVALPSPKETPRPSGKPNERFTFADWDDEEARR